MALVGYMQPDLVERRRWFTPEAYREGLATDRFLWILFAVATLVTAWTESEIIWVFVGAGFVALLVRARPFARAPRMALAVGLLPHFRRLSRSRALKAFVDGVTAAATGAIAGAAFVLGRRALVDLTAVGIALGSLLVLTRYRRMPEPLLIAAAGALGILLGPGPASGAAQRAPTGDAAPSRLVVFVCEHGSAKSLAAASFFERMAKEHGVAVRAVSRGTSPDASVPPAVVAVLEEDGFDVASFRPQALKESDVAAATRVVAIGVDIGEIGARASTPVERWDDIPPFSAGYPNARKALVSRIDSLLRDLKRQAPEDRRR